jgi:hypothetical protein
MIDAETRRHCKCELVYRDQLADEGLTMIAIARIGDPVSDCCMKEAIAMVMLRYVARS